MDRIKNEELAEKSEINSVQQRSSTRVRTCHMTSEEGRKQGSTGKEVKQAGEEKVRVCVVRG